MNNNIDKGKVLELFEQLINEGKKLEKELPFFEKFLGGGVFIHGLVDFLSDLKQDMESGALDAEPTENMTRDNKKLIADMKEYAHEVLLLRFRQRDNELIFDKDVLGEFLMSIIDNMFAVFGSEIEHDIERPCHACHCTGKAGAE